MGASVLRVVQSATVLSIGAGSIRSPATYQYVEVEPHLVETREREHATWVLQRSLAVNAMDAPPQIRWFRTGTHHRQPERDTPETQPHKPAWLTFSAAQALRGITFAGNPHEIWVRVGQSLEELAETIEHEGLHSLQLQIYGTKAVVRDNREQFEAAALRYGEYARGGSRPSSRAYEPPCALTSANYARKRLRNISAGSLVEGHKTWLWCGSFAWSRHCVLVPIRDKTCRPLSPASTSRFVERYIAPQRITRRRWASCVAHCCARSSLLHPVTAISGDLVRHSIRRPDAASCGAVC